MLQAEGFVVGEPKKRVRIAELTRADAEELFRLRMLLESTAARLAARPDLARTSRRWRATWPSMDDDGRGRDCSALREPHRAFHARLVDGAGPRTLALILELFDHAERYRVFSIAPPEEHWAERQSEHRRLVAAAAEGDADGTAVLLEQHYTRHARADQLRARLS